MMKTTQNSISIKLLQTSFFALLFLFSFSIFSQTNVTFSVNTENIEVGANGIYVGGGVLGGSDAYALSDDDGDGVWVTTIALAPGTTGNYAFFNSPNGSSDLSLIHI